jgi:solute:Na+ symporter, SSS family
MAVKFIVVALYAIIVVFIGIIGMRRTKSFKDFFLAGGKVGPWLSAFSYGTAYFSAVMFIGFAGKVGWGFGYSGLWITFGNAFIGVLAVWAILGWRIKKMSEEYNVSTMSEFLHKRYNSPFLKMAGVVVIFIFMIPYSAAVFMGLSYLFEVSFNIDYWLALTLMGVFTATYIILGGYKSMAIIDVFFGIIMVVSVSILLIFTVNKGGGFANITESLNAINPQLTDPVGPPGFWPLFSLVFLTAVAPFALPQLVQKFYAIRDKKSVRIGMFASTVFALLISFVGFFVGSTTRVFIKSDNPAQQHLFKFTESGVAIPDFDKLMPELLSNMLPGSLSIIILILILSASMSTLAALVLISSSSIAKDLYGGFINKNASDKSLTRLMRIMSGVFVFLAVLLALVEFDVIVEILGVSWGAIGAFFLGPFVWGLFSKKTTKLAAISSAVVGLSICLGLYFAGLRTEPGQALEWYYTSPGAGTIGMIVSLSLAPIISIPAFFKSKTK